MARAHGDSVDQKAAAELGDRAPEVVCPGAPRAAGGDHDVGRQVFTGRIGVLEGGEPLGVGVADFHFFGTDPAEHSHHGGQLGSEGVADLPGCRHPARHDLGASENEADHGLAEHGKGVTSGQRGEGQMGRVQDRAALDQYVPGGGFLPGLPDVVAVARVSRLRGAAQLQDGQAVLVDVDDAAFAAQHGLGPGRDEAAGGNRAGLMWCQTLAGFGQDPGAAAVDGPAVHGRGSVMGHVLPGNDVRRERPAERLPQRNRGGRDGNGALERELPGLLPRVGQVPVRLRGALVPCLLVRCILVRSVFARCILVRRDVRATRAVYGSLSTASSDAISAGIVDAIFTAISARGSGAVAVRGRSRHAPEVSAAA
ncbi:hypothetical protein SRABI128_05037 [Microbacterium sp. Bi128]|nr:hypothetical protein SRABI128_05037 [Microbacterium sp. Bi128]